MTQARTTIPKWIQRSTMDAMDKVISVLVYTMIRKNQEDNPGNQNIMGEATNKQDQNNLDDTEN